MKVMEVLATVEVVLVKALVMVDKVRVSLVREASLDLVAEDPVQEASVMEVKVRVDSIREAPLDIAAVELVKEALEAMVSEVYQRNFVFFGSYFNKPILKRFFF